jgi:hypothetical protein
MQHLVWLQPGQTFFLQLNKEYYPNAKIELTSKYLNHYECTQAKVEGEKEYLFTQVGDVAEWAEFSACHLGDVWIDSDFHTSRLSVMLSCRNPQKKDFTTVINPDCTDLRLSGHGVLEVIVCEETFKDEDEWCWEWSPAFDNLQIEQINYDSIKLGTWNQFFRWSAIDDRPDRPSDPFARASRFVPEDNDLCRQHHFWFRFDKTILDLVPENLGMKHVGNLKFYGFENRFDKNSGAVEKFLAINVNLNNIDRFKLYRTLMLNANAKGGPVTDPVHSAVLNHLKKNSGNKTYHFYKKNLCYDVDLQVLNSVAMDEGCKTIPIMYEPKDEPSPHRQDYERDYCGPRGHSRCGHFPYDHDEFYDRDIYDWWR